MTESAPASKVEYLAEFVERRKHVLLAGLTAVYAVGVAGRAAARPFWYDEIITLVSAKMPTWSAAWEAARVTDASPPLPHMATHLAIRFFGLSEVTARLPAMVGFWVFCLCLFAFVARRKGALIGLSALLLPVVTEAFAYATEARAYGLELGFCGLVLVAWQSAADGRRRAVALVTLAAAIAGMLMCHYYGALVYLPLAGGELVRARRKRKIDWGVAAAMAAGVAPLVWRFFAVLGAVQGFAHGWSSAYLRQGLEFWQTGLAPAAPWLALLVFLLALTRRRARVDDSACDVPEHEWVAGALFVTIPLAEVIAALTVTHAFTPRYALIGLAGFCILVPFLVAEYAGARSIAGAVMAAVLAWGAAVTMIDHGGPRNPFTEEAALGKALEQGPVVVSDGQLFLQMWHYAPERLKPRLVFLADEAAAIRYMGFDTIDGGLRPLKPWAHINLIDYADFVKPTREFLLYRNLVRPEWVTPRVIDEGASPEVLKVGFNRELVRVRLK